MAVSLRDVVSFGRYEPLFRIASGGMAEVYAARIRGEAGFQKLVAVKRMHPHLAADASFVDMFLNEARLAAHVASPHVVQTLDLGRGSDGSLYLVMELVVGLSLAALEGELPAPIAVELVAQAAQGLDDAHEATTPAGDPLGLIHRDVSPHNILLGIDGRARVTDFGIAHAVHRPRAETNVKELKGKFAYMSPEQTKLRRLDRRSDVFSLGVVAWELLVGRRLFATRDPADTIRRVRAARVPPPHEAEPSIPEAVSAVVLEALDRDPERRFGTAADLARALREAGREAFGELPERKRIADFVRQAGGEELERLRRLIRLGTEGAELDALEALRPGATRVLSEDASGVSRLGTGARRGTERLEDASDDPRHPGTERLEDASDDPRHPDTERLEDATDDPRHPGTGARVPPCPAAIDGSRLDGSGEPALEAPPPWDADAATPRLRARELPAIPSVRLRADDEPETVARPAPRRPLHPVDADAWSGADVQETRDWRAVRAGAAAPAPRLAPELLDGGGRAGEEASARVSGAGGPPFDRRASVAGPGASEPAAAAAEPEPPTRPYRSHQTPVPIPAAERDPSWLRGATIGAVVGVLVVAAVVVTLLLWPAEQPRVPLPVEPEERAAAPSTEPPPTRRSEGADEASPEPEPSRTTASAPPPANPAPSEAPPETASSETASREPAPSRATRRPRRRPRAGRPVPTPPRERAAEPDGTPVLLDVSDFDRHH